MTKRSQRLLVTCISECRCPCSLCALGSGCRCHAAPCRVCAQVASPAPPHPPFPHTPQRPCCLRLQRARAVDCAARAVLHVQVHAPLPRHKPRETRPTCIFRQASFGRHGLRKAGCHCAVCRCTGTFARVLLCRYDAEQGLLSTPHTPSSCPS